MTRDPHRDLLERFLHDGDDAAMEALVAATRKKLLGVAARIGAPQDAEDTVQAAYHALLRRRPPPPDAPFAWLVTTVVRIAYRRKAVARRYVTLADRLARPEPRNDPSSGAARSEERHLVRQEVARLPSRFRDAVVLHHLEGLSVTEVARLLDVPVSTVKTRLHRGRTLLRGRLAPLLAYVLLGAPWTLTDAARAASSTLPNVLGGSMEAKTTGLVLGITLAAGAVGMGLGTWGRRNEVSPQRQVARADDRASVTALKLAQETSSALGDHNDALDVTDVQPRAPRTEAVAEDGQRKPYDLSGHTADPSSAILRVSVVDETGTPHAGASVQLTRYVLGRQAKRVELESGADGRVEIRDFPPGKPQLAVRLASSRQWVGVVDLVEGRVTEATVVIPRTGASIEGQVRCRGEGPLNGAYVTLSRRGEWFTDYLQAKTGVGGHYRIEAVPPNTYRVKVSGPTLGWRSRRAAPVTVAGSDPVQRDIEIGIVSLSGVVRDAATRRPLRDVTVRLQRSSGECVTDAQGRYRFLDVSAEAGKLVLIKKGYELRFVDVDALMLGAERVLDVDLRPASTLHLHIADDRGRPVAGDFRLLLVDRHDPTGTMITTDVRADADGHAVYKKIPPGSYELALRQGGSRWPAAEFEVHAGENTIHFRLPTRAERETPMLAGTVRDAATGHPVPGATVRVRRFGAKTDTDDHGRFRFHRLPVSDQELGIEKDGYGYALARATNLTKGKTREVDVELKPGATLRLSIKTREGAPVTKPVRLVFLPPKGRAGLRWGASLKLDSPGHASYRCVPPGEYTLLVVSDDGAARVDLDARVGDVSIGVRLD